jgi:SAM-dependent methyltransferase
MSRQGRYDGFDIVADGIAWCRERISRRFPHFRFRLVDVRNRYYNPHGGVEAAEYVFPYPDGFFDVAVLASVFTHLTPPDAARYVAEVARVLRPGGRCLATFFLLNEESRRLSAAGVAHRHFPCERDGMATVNPDCPERAVAHDEEQVRRLLGQHGLRVNEPVRYGSWCGRTEYLSHQDVVLAVKQTAR